MVNGLFDNIIRNRGLNYLYVNCAQTFGGFFDFEGYFVSFVDVFLKIVLVNEDVFTALIGGNEAKSFGVVEKLYCSVTHFKLDIDIRG